MLQTISACKGETEWFSCVLDNDWPSLGSAGGRVQPEGYFGTVAGGVGEILYDKTIFHWRYHARRLCLQ